MKHPSSRALFAYWDAQRGLRAAPERADIDPAAIRHILADTFVLAADFSGACRFRLAGTRICSLFVRELKDQPFLGLWNEASLASMRELTDIVEQESLGVVAGATGVTAQGDTIDLELLLLPLSRRGHARVRALGVLAPLSPPPYWLGSHPVRELQLGALRHVGSGIDGGVAASLTAPPPGGRMRHGFTVYDGGHGQIVTEPGAG